MLVAFRRDPKQTSFRFCAPSVIYHEFIAFLPTTSMQYWK
jgi:hypothetical protein